MRRKISISLLIISLLICGGLAWTHFQRIDLEAEAKVAAAEKDRHGYVISHDFGLLKEKLIESHRDHWQNYAKMERLARWEFAGIVALMLIMILLLVMGVRKKSTPSA
jgi:hypothetical protein